MVDGNKEPPTVQREDYEPGVVTDHCPTGDIRVKSWRFSRPGAEPTQLIAPHPLDQNHGWLRPLLSDSTIHRIVTTLTLILRAGNRIVSRVEKVVLYYCWSAAAHARAGSVGGRSLPVLRKR